MKNDNRIGASSFCAVLLALTCVQAAIADTAVVWTNLTSFTEKSGIQTDPADSTYWGIAANWTNSAGAALTVAPTNAADRFAVTLPELGLGNASLYRKTISTKTSGGGVAANLAVDPSVASISGGERYTIRHADVAEASTIQYPAVGRVFTVENPNGFTGFWEMQEPRSRVCLGGADGTFVPVLWNLDLLYRATVSVPADGTGRIEALAGDGVLVKTDAGTLEIGTTSGDGNGLFVEGGEIHFDGVAADGCDLQALLAKASFHLDMTADDSFITSNGEGRVYVTRWNDVRGNGKFAYVPTSGFSTAADKVHFAHAPYVSEETSPTGCRLLDFGSAPADAPAFGPTNCFMRFDSETAREVFYVARYKGASPRGVFIISSNTYPLHMSGRRLISPTYAAYGVRAGDLMINGRKFECAENPRANEIESLYAFSAGSLTDIAFSTLGTDREYAASTGGILIGEVILFDQPLTRAERVAVNRYLLGKWRSGAAYDRAFGSVRSKVDLTVDVPAGRTVSIGDLALDSGKKLVKTGEGRLEIGTLTPATATVDLRGGVVKFSPTRLKSVPTAPAGGSLYWFDGSAEGDLALAADDTHVNGWNDHVHAGVSVTIQHGKNNTAVPTVVRKAFGDLSAVSFGSSADDKCYAQLPNWKDYTTDDVSVRSGFIAFRFNALNSSSPFIGSGNRIDFIRRNRMLLSDSYLRSRPSSANWAINGVPADPWVQCKDGEALYQNADFVVVSFDSSLGQFLQGLAVDRNADNACGGVTIGEVIAYNRRLSAAERIATEAYLMDKWQGRAHPAAVQSTPTYVFSPDDPVVISSDADVTLTKVMGNGSVYKDGAGTLTLATDNRETNRAAVAVLGGTLATSFADNFVDRSFMRYDASRLDKMTYYASEDGVYTNVTQIRSVNKDSILLNSAKGATGNAVTNPSLVTVEMRTGVNRSCLDFGTFNTLSGENLSSALQNSYGNAIREFHVVYADRLVAKNPTYQSLFCSYTADYYKRSSVNLLAADAPDYARTGYLAVDGCETSPDMPLTEGFHLISAVPNITDGTTMITPTLARSARGCGGCQIAELVLYDTNSSTNTVKERTYLEEQLMHKWFDAPLARWPYGIDNVSVAAGATWRDTSASVRFLVGELDLRGTADVAEIRVGEAMAVSGGQAKGDLGLADGAVVTIEGALDAETPALTVDGTLTFTGKLTLDILPDWDGDRLDVGTYPLIHAASFVRTDSDAPFGAADCEFTCPDALVHGRVVSLIYDAATKTLSLNVQPKGLLMIVR